MEHFFQAALAPSSQRTYKSAQYHYLNFCRSVHCPPLPLTEHLLCQFASQLANESLSHSTIKGYISAVRHLQIAAGLPDPAIPNMPKLGGVLKGIKSLQAKSLPTKRNRFPITPSILLRICGVWELQGISHDQIMLWAAVTLSFFGVLRSGEVTVPSDHSFDPAAHITFSDISVDHIQDPQSVKLRLKASKTDPFRRGVDIVVGKTINKLCPVSALLAYMAIRGSKPGFLFQFEDGRLLTKKRFVDAVREALSLAGLNPKDYAGHSFRIGAATTAGACGLNDSTIQMLSRWSSSAYLVYIRTPRENFSSDLGHSAA